MARAARCPAAGQTLKCPLPSTAGPVAPRLAPPNPKRSSAALAVAPHLLLGGHADRGGQADAGSKLQCLLDSQVGEQDVVLRAGHGGVGVRWRRRRSPLMNGLPPAGILRRPSRPSRNSRRASPSRAVHGSIAATVPGFNSVMTRRAASVASAALKHAAVIKPQAGATIACAGRHQHGIAAALPCLHDVATVAAEGLGEGLPICQDLKPVGGAHAAPAGRMQPRQPQRHRPRGHVPGAMCCWPPAR